MKNYKAKFTEGRKTNLVLRVLLVSDWSSRRVKVSNITIVSFEGYQIFEKIYFSLFRIGSTMTSIISISFVPPPVRRRSTTDYELLN